MGNGCSSMAASDIHDEPTYELEMQSPRALKESSIHSGYEYLLLSANHMKNGKHERAIALIESAREYFVVGMADTMVQYCDQKKENIWKSFKEHAPKVLPEGSKRRLSSVLRQIFD